MDIENLWVATATFDYSWQFDGYINRSEVFRFFKADTQKQAEQYIRDNLMKDPTFEDWGIITLSRVHEQKDTGIAGISNFTLHPVSAFNGMLANENQPDGYVDIIREDEVSQRQYEEELFCQKYGI